MQIDGQVAFVAGGASGLGEATARLLAERGATVVVADRDATRGEKVAAEVGGRFVAADVSDEAAVEAALAMAAGSGLLRVAVSCAGIGWADRVLGADGSPHPAAGFEKVLRVNLLGTFNVMRLAARLMATLPAVDDDGERGVIINTASVAAYEGQTGQVAYAASKGGIVAMTLPAARDLSVVGIRVCTIVPGLMDTPLASTMPAPNRQRLAAQALFPARFGRPSEYALLVAHIVENRYVNGECIRLDAGLRLPVK
jgi:NAD(P)-dependent dehydrogenase (short-subunit alcohol dehydrogenase family)